jgi:uncharacterized protein involved in propanediol utilization
MTRNLVLTSTTVPREPFFPDTYEAKLDTQSKIEGQGYSIGHHGELIQGIFEDQDGFHRGLVTLPCEFFHSQASFNPDTHSNRIVAYSIREPKIYEAAELTKACKAAKLTLEECGYGSYGGFLLIRSNIPEGWGCGSSTSDVVASIRAVANAFETVLPPHVIAEISVRAEIASDSVMWGNRAVLFAQREAVILEEFNGVLPHLHVLGFNTDLTGAGVDTLNHPPADYNLEERETFRYLRGLMRHAIQTKSASLVGYVASASARINQRYLPKPHFKALEKIVQEAGAVGLQVAHSGTIAGLLFDPRCETLSEQVRYARARLAKLDFKQTWEFAVSNARREVLG